MGDTDSNGWNEWGTHVIKTLERQENMMAKLAEKVDNLQSSNILEMGNLKLELQNKMTHHKDTIIRELNNHRETTSTLADNLTEKFNTHKLETTTEIVKLTKDARLNGLLAGAIPPSVAILILWIKNWFS